MNKKLILSMCSLFIIAVLLFAAAPASAQTDEGSLTLSFADLGLDEFTVLQGPYQSHSLQFRLPADWDLEDGAQFKLDFTSFFSLYVSIQGNEEVQKVFAGALTVYLNGEHLESYVVEKEGDHSLEIALPAEYLKTQDGLVKLTFEWDSTHSCYQNISTYVLLGSDSSITIPYSQGTISTSLADFPQPFYAPLSISPSDTAIVIPTDANAEEISAAMAVSAGLGRYSHGALDVKVYHEGQLSVSALDDYHLIYVGDLTGFDALTGTGIQTQYGNKLAEHEIENTDGVVVSSVSPHNPAHLLVAVSGATPEAVLKAGQAFGSGQLLLDEDQNFSVVKDYLSGAIDTDTPEQFTLAILGQTDIVFSDFGISEIDIEFYFPQGSSTSSGAYIDVYFNHSRLLDYLQSNMWLEINGTYISSIQFNDNNADLSLIRFIIPPTAVVGGRNVLTIGANIAARNICADPRSGDIWVQIFADSSFTMPRMDQSIAIKASAQTTFPEMFLLSGNLNDTLFVISNDNFAAWKAAVDISSFIGSYSPGNNSFPSAVFVRDVKDEDLTDKNIILITDLDVLNSGSPEMLWDILPVDSSGELFALVGGRTVYELDQTQDYGLISLSELEGGKVGLGIVTKGTGVIGWTSDVLLNAQLLAKLSTEKFAIVQGPNAFLMDVETISEEALVDSTVPDGDDTEVVDDSEVDQAVTFVEVQNKLIITVLVILVVLLLVLIYFGYKDIIQNRWF